MAEKDLTKNDILNALRDRNPNRATSYSSPLMMASDVPCEQQPRKTYRFALNTELQDSRDTGVLSTERGNAVSVKINDGHTRILLGKIYVGDDENVLFTMYRTSSGQREITVSEIYLTDRDGSFRLLATDTENTSLLQPSPLNFSEHHQIYGTYRMRMGCEKVVYFTDDFNPPRCFNINHPELYRMPVEDSEPLLYGNCVIAEKMRLQKCYGVIPDISAEIGEDGRLLAGSYNISVRYIDEDLNPTEWIYTTEPIIIFHDRINDSDFGSVRGSSNDDVDYRKYGPTSKSIKVSSTISHTDDSYIFIQFALIGANAGTGYVNDVMYSPLIEIAGSDSGNAVFSFTGGSDVSEGSEEEIIADTVVYDRAGWIEQADNRLVMGNMSEMDIDWCKLQKYASRITADCVMEMRKENDMKAGHRNPFVLFDGKTGYQPGEIYSFGIVYVFENGAKSPVYHIPGKAPGCGSEIYSSVSDVTHRVNILPMSCDNACTNATYPRMTSSCEGFDYWGRDCKGNRLAGTHIRHHRFPLRSSRYFVHTENMNVETKYMFHYNLILGIVEGHSISCAFRKNFNYILVKYNIGLYDDYSAVGTQPSPEEKASEYRTFELHIDYDDLDSMDRKIDCSERSYTDWKHPIMYSSNPRGKGHLYAKASINGLTADISESQVLEQFTYKGTARNTKLKKGKTKKITNIYEFIKTEYNIARLDTLQEYPQFVDTDGMEKKPKLLTTGSKIVPVNGQTHGWGQSNSANVQFKNNSILEFFENVDDSFFESKYPYSYLQRDNFGFEIPQGNITASTNIDSRGDYRIIDYIGTSVRVMDIIEKNNELEIEGCSAYSGMSYGNLKRRHNGRVVRLRFDFRNDNDDSYIKWIRVEPAFKNDGTATRNAYIIDSRIVRKAVYESEYINSSIGYSIEMQYESIQEMECDCSGYIYGIQFGNIEMPDPVYLNGHTITGYYIVRNERTDDDMTVLDSAVLTPMFNRTGYEGFIDNTVVSSRILYDGTTSGASSSVYNYRTNGFLDIYQKDSVLPAGIEDRICGNAAGFINPRFKFLKKELRPDRIRLIGYYSLPKKDTRGARLINHSTDYNDGWKINDVQDGSSYNSSVNSKKDRDSDGIDLHIYHKNAFAVFSNTSVPSVTEYSADREDFHYLAPMSYIDAGGMKLFNASYDNSTGMICNLKDSDGNTVNMKTFFTEKGFRIERLPYVYLERDIADCYSDFRDRPYFRDSEFIPSTEETCLTFNGDCFMSPMKYTTGSLYDIRMKKRKKKATWWQYLTGAVLAVGGTVGAVFTGGATASLVGPGISMIQNGMKIDVAYRNQGVFTKMKLKDTLNDAWVKKLIDTEQDDDEMQWIFESIDNLWFESQVNMNWRIGSNDSNVTDYLNPLSGYNGDEMRKYFTAKLTYDDRNRKDGKTYLGYAQAEIYELNRDYCRRNRQKMFYCIPVTHRCCSECGNLFPQRLVYSQKSFAEERTDNYRVLLPGNYKDLDGETGEITAVLYSGSSGFLILTEEGAYQLPSQGQQRANPETQIVSFIGTGDFFASEAQRLAYSDMNISYGCRHRASILKCPEGIFWYSAHDNAIYWQNAKGITDITFQFQMKRWFDREGRIHIDDEYYRKYRTEYPYSDNPSSHRGTGYVMGYDSSTKRVLITKRDNQIALLDNQCLFGSREAVKAEMLSYIETLKNAGKVNICYRWSQEDCGYIIEYETMTPVEKENVSQVSDVRYDNSRRYCIIYISEYNNFTDSSGNTIDVISKMLYDLSQNAGEEVIVASTERILEMFGFDKDNPSSTIKDYGIKTMEIKSTAYYDSIGFLKHLDNDSVTYELDGKTYVIDTKSSVIDAALVFNEYHHNDKDTSDKVIESLSERYEGFSVSYFPVLKRNMNSEIDSDSFSESYRKSGHDGKWYEYITEDTELEEEERQEMLIEECESADALSKEYRQKIEDAKRGDRHFGTDIDISVFETINAYYSYRSGLYDANMLITDTKKHIRDVEEKNVSYSYCTEAYSVIYAKYIAELEESYSTANGCDNTGLLSSLYRDVKVIPSRRSIPVMTDSEIAVTSSVMDMNCNESPNVSVNLGMYADRITEEQEIHGFNTADIVNANERLTDSVRYDIQSTVKHTYGKYTFALTVEPFYGTGRTRPKDIDSYDNVPDNSFTLSFNVQGGFESFHSYLPAMYVQDSRGFLTYRTGDDLLWRHGIEGSYLSFYGTKYPMVIELVSKSENITLGPQITDSVSLYAYGKKYVDGEFADERNIFFDNAYFYNSRQCTAFSAITVKNSIDAEDYLVDYMDASQNSICAEKRENYWHINSIYDAVVNHSIPIHTENIVARSQFMISHSMNGWIDKAISSGIYGTQNWWEQEPLKDMYICQRYFYNKPASQSNIKFSVVLNTTNNTQSFDNTIE